MTSRDVLALTAAALLIGAGAAHAQALTNGPAPERVVVDITGKSMPLVRADLLHASEAVCTSDEVFTKAPNAECVDATYRRALFQAKASRAALTARPAQVASR